MLGCTGNFQDQSADPSTSVQDLYIHGYVSGRMFRKGKDAQDEGLAITVSATYVRLKRFTTPSLLPQPITPLPFPTLTLTLYQPPRRPRSLPHPLP